ncbi:MAG: type III pantothenate kinase [Paenibacillaceae bacterium]|jgi:type III pantothenate kinase|nr:type III pantothenate kinase [Paenibacillaceae bacterium]
MMLAVDIGNTNTTIGLWNEDVLSHECRIVTHRTTTSDELGLRLLQWCTHIGVDVARIRRIVISSVVPPVDAQWAQMAETYVQCTPLFVNAAVAQRAGLAMLYAYPQEIGADRLVNAIAAMEQYGTPLIVVDFGTATTFCYVDASGAYVGGVIAPGVATSSEALVARAAKLSRIELTTPKHVIGATTIEAMQSGVLYGVAGQVDGIVRRIQAQCGCGAAVVATGGWAKCIAALTETSMLVDPQLTLRGLAVVARRVQEEV